MEQKVRICVVEDEAIIAASIQKTLLSLGYDVPKPVASYDQAIAMLETERPDLALLDVKLKGSKDGVEVAKYIREKMDIPFIFLTANNDAATMERAKPVKPNAFLVKPFKKEDLYAAIEIAISNFTFIPEPDKPKEKQVLLKDALFIKDGYYFHKVQFDDVLYITSDNVYVTVQTRDKKYLVRASLPEYHEKFDNEKFVRVHQRYVVNIAKIDKINSAYILVNNEEIPVSKSYRDTLLASLNLG